MMSRTYVERVVAFEEAARVVEEVAAEVAREWEALLASDEELRCSGQTAPGAERVELQRAVLRRAAAAIRARGGTGA